MKTRDYIPKSFSGLADFLTNFLNVVSDAQVRFGIDAAKLAALQLVINNYLSANTIAKQASATKSDITNRQVCAKAAVAALRKFFNSELRYNDAVTDPDRTDMHIPIPDTTPTPVPVPTTHPVFSPDRADTLRIVLNFKDNQKPKKGKPEGVHGCEIIWAVLDTPPAGIEDLNNSAFTTKASHIFTFNVSQRGKEMYFRGRWENTKGEKGPWGDLQDTIIP